MVPSGAMVPVMAIFGFTVAPVMAAMVPTVSAPPPDGPSMAPVMS